ncbi:MAG TPA: ketol-acid reductoisomerase [Fimbriimonadaceae bacterium]|nr:ketol-acid reductoisomerase [Fimbriimonadaceae bacterium]
MAHFYETNSVNLSALEKKRIAILGFGNQGSAHARNLHDGGFEVVVGLRESSPTWKTATELGLTVKALERATEESDVVMLALPDVPMGGIYLDTVAPFLRAGQMVLLCHGFNAIYGVVRPPDEVGFAVVSPKGSGHSLRKAFLEGGGLPAMVAIENDPTGDVETLALAYAVGIGCKGPLLKTTAREETETDLFGEQVVLCGGLIELIKAAYEHLVERGYQPEAAFFECVYESKLIVDLLLSKGLAGMRHAISDTAEWGGYLAGPRVVSAESKEAMATILDDIQSGSFARTWMAEMESGGHRLKALRGSESSPSMDATWSELKSQGLST